MAVTESIGSAVLAAKDILGDPYLPEVSCHLLRVNRMERGLNPGAPCERTRATPAQIQRGVGMRFLVGPLRFMTWARQNPALAVGIVAGSIGMIYYLGYSQGKRKRS